MSLISKVNSLSFICGSVNWCISICRYLPGVSLLWHISLYILKCIVGTISVLLKFLFYNTLCYFKSLSDLFAMDFLANRFVRFEVVLLLVSFLFGIRLLISFYVLENNAISTFSNLYFNSNFFECEIWDMFGIIFVGSQRGLFHIFLDYGFKGYPLRKDFSLLGYNLVNFSYYVMGLFLSTGYIFNCSVKAETACWSLII